MAPDRSALIAWSVPLDLLARDPRLLGRTAYFSRIDGDLFTVDDYDLNFAGWLDLFGGYG